MFDHEPGSPAWWQETAVITLAGLTLAAWLWIGPIIAAQSPQSPRPVTLGDLFDQGCMDAAALRALREGREFDVSCPQTFPQVQNGPPQNRLFP